MHARHSKAERGTISDDDEEEDCATPAERAAAARAALSARALAFFQRLPFFDSTPLSALEGLAAAAQHYTTTRNEVIIQQGAPCEDGIFFIAKGNFRVVQELPIYTRAVDEAAAAKLFTLPTLLPEAAAAQRVRLQAAEERHAQRQSIESSVEPSPYSSRTSLHNTVFLTADQTRSTQSLAAPPPGRSPRSHRASPSAASTSAAAASSSAASAGRDLTAINEVTPAESVDGDYVDLDAYDSKTHRTAQQHRRRQSQQQQQQQQGNPRSDGSPRKHVSSSQASLSSLSSPRGAAASIPRANQSILVGSRFLDVGDLGPFGMFGERGVMLREARSASVISRSAGGELWAITRFDFLRLQTRKALHALRNQCLSGYRSVEELSLELDDSDQWSHYKSHLLQCSKDRAVRSHKLGQMPVWETVPVKPFSIRLPQMKSQAITSSVDHLQPRNRAAEDAAAITSKSKQQHTGTNHDDAAPLAAASTSSSPHAVFSYLSGSSLSDPRPAEKYSSRRGVLMPPISSASSRASSGSNTARNGSSKQTKAEARAARGAHTTR